MSCSLKNNFIPFEEYMIGTRLKERLKDYPDIGYFKTEHLTVEEARKSKVIVTAHSDYPCDQILFDQYNHSDLKRWFARHATIKHPKVEGVPVGLQEPVTPVLGNTMKIFEKSQEIKKNDNLVYLCWRDETFGGRKKVRGLYQDKSWVRVDPVCRERTGFERYLDGLYNHKFVLCPRGNGPESIRMWESLVLRSIPIVERSQAMSYFEDLPILWVDSWDDVLTESYLEEKYEEIINKEFDLGPLTVSYWADKIIKASQES